MGGTALAALESSRHKADPVRVPALKPHGPAHMPARAGAGNMAIQRAAAGPLAGRDAAAILGGAAMSSSGCSCGGTCEECKKKPVQRKAEGDAPDTSTAFHGALHRSGSGAPLPSHTRSMLEGRFGDTFENVRIHDDGAAADAARHIQAHAFTMGHDVYFGHGRYQPDSTAGQKLLAHELTHVLQQRRGAVLPGLKSMTASRDDSLEREAEQAEAQVGKEDHDAPARRPFSLVPGLGHSGPSRSNAPQRKCACGGTCAKCSAKQEEEPKVPGLQRKAETAAPPVRETPAPPRENKLPKERTAKREAPRNERNAARQPGPGGQARGRGARHAGPGHSPNAGIQRSASAPSAGAAHGARHDALEHEADAAASTVTRGRHVASERLSQAQPDSIQAVDWQWCVPYVDPDCTISSTADVVSSEAQEIADDVKHAAQRFADAVGGVLDYIDNLLTITIPPKHVCDPHSIQLSLDEISKDIPFLEGEIPIDDVLLYGEVGLHLGLTPEIGLQIGPCETHEIKIAIHPISMSGSVSGGFDVTLAASIGGELRAGLYGEVGVKILWPDPPVLITIPVANLQAGLAGFARGIAADHLTLDFRESASLTGFDFDLERTDRLGFALDLGLAGYGALTVLGFNVCTLYWPLYKAHRETTLNLGLGLGLSASSSSVSLAVDAEAGNFNDTSWDDLGIELNRDMFKDDCPLCDFLKTLGLMPSDFGGKWTGHPEPAWKVGPLHGVFPRAPKLKSGAECRGACGPDCDTCYHEDEHYECEDTPGGHIWWVYPRYEMCGTHLGCRNHDACYDWCTDKTGFKGPLGIALSPCHRWCDFECICNYNLPQCVGWIMGEKPHDGTMFFSDLPKTKPGCHTPCPHRTTHRKGGADDWLVCLPTLQLFPRKTVAAPPLDEKTGRHTIWRKDVWIPYVGLATLEIFASGHLHGELSAGLGPGAISNICFKVDPRTGTYKARGELRIPAQFLASLTAGAELGADARWFLIIKVASAKGTLEATGRLAGNAALVLSGQVEVSCRGGKPTLESDLDIPGCVEFQFDLNAGFDVNALGFNVFSRKWNLFSARWDKCWGEDVMVKHTGKDPLLDLRDKTIDLSDLFEWLLSDKAEHTEPPGKQRQIKESPLTTATAKTVPELAPQLDQTTHSTGAVTLNSGASSTVGLDMMTRFLTFEHSPGTEDTSKAQKNIYGFRKLPTRGAGAGNGFSAKEYIKGHLLNGKLGGLAEDGNLFPITAAANHNHSDKVENKVKELVKDRKLVALYGVRVTGQDGPHNIDVLGDGTCTYEFLNATFDCTFAKYTLFTDNTVELLDAKDEPISSTFNRADFIADVKAKNCPQK